MVSIYFLCNYKSMLRSYSSKVQKNYASGVCIQYICGRVLTICTNGYFIPRFFFQLGVRSMTVLVGMCKPRPREVGVILCALSLFVFFCVFLYVIVGTWFERFIRN